VYRRLVLLAVALLMALSAVPALAATASVGMSSTTISVVSMDASHDVNDITKRYDVDVAVAAGLAVTDPLLSAMVAANFQFLAAKIQGLDNPLVTETVMLKTESASAFGGEDASDVSGTAKSLESLFPVPPPSGLVSGNVTLTAMTSEVKPRVPSAKSALGDGTADISVNGGMVDLQGMKIGITNDSNPTQANAVQGVEVAKLYVLPLDQLLDRAGLDADDILELAGTFGGTTLTAQVAAADAARDNALAQLSACLSGGSAVVSGVTIDCTALRLLGLSGPTDTSIEGVLAYLGRCPALLTLAAPTLCSALAAEMVTLNALLKDALGAMPLLTITNLRVGATAQATDTTSAGNAWGVWDSAEVVGIPVEPLGDPNGQWGQLDALINDFEALVDALTSTNSFDLELIPIDIRMSEDNAKDGDYMVASSTVSVMRIIADIPGAPTGSSGAAAGDTFHFDSSLFTLAANARHRPLVLGDSSNNLGGPGTDNNLGGPGSGCNGPGSPMCPLANTGLEELVTLCGLAALALGLRLRRWLGDAA